MIPLGKNLLMRAASVLHDPVTTTDELIPSGETSSYRSNPLRLAEFALSRKDPAYVGKAKAIKADEDVRRETGHLPEKVRKDVEPLGISEEGTVYGSFVAAVKPETVRRASRRLPASACSAASRTSQKNMRPSVTAAISSTGECFPSPRINCI